MLGGEDLGWRHEGGLVAVFDGDECGLEGDDGFAGAYVALQQAAHGLGAAHVGDDFAEDAFLRGGGFEGEDLFEGFADLVVGDEGGAVAVAEPAAFEFEAEFEVEELFEDEAAVGGGAGGHEVGHGGAGGGEVEGAEGVHAGGDGRRAAEAVGRVFGGVGAVGPTFDAAATNGAPGFGAGVGFGEVFEDGPEDAAEPAGGEFAAPGGFAAEGLVDGDDAAHLEQGELGVFAGGVGVGEDLEGGLDHFEAGGAGDGAEGVAGCGEPSSLP